MTVTRQITFRMSRKELEKMRKGMKEEGTDNVSEFVRRAIMHKINGGDAA